MELPATTTRQNQSQRKWPITVAVAEHDPIKRKCLEQYLRNSDQTITVLTDSDFFYRKKTERQFKSHDILSLHEQTFARIKRLEPRILFVNTHQLTDESIDLLYNVNQNCYGTLPIVLVKEQTDDDQILNALKNGARGIVDCSKSPLNLPKVIYAVDSGEPWISRRILEKIMGKIKFTQ